MPIAKPVVCLFQGVFAVAASRDMRTEKEILTRPDVRLKYAASRKGNLRPAPIAPIILPVT